MGVSSFKQAPHKLLVIPGPIEFSDEVLLANATPAVSHVSLPFAPVFGDCIRMLREVLYAPNGQPFLVAGSGTLGWDMAAVNLVEPGEEALVLNNGYFGDCFAACLETYGAKVTKLTSPIGGLVTDEELIEALKSKPFKLVTFTHVDTSTGVLTPIAHFSELVHKYCPTALIAVDAVCSVASEEIQFDAWGLDVIISATQKGIGAPPGLSVVMASQKALKVVADRKTVIPNYYASWKSWLPIMEAYEAGQVKYFATPPVQLIYSLHAALSAITRQSPSLEGRFEAHKAASKYVKDSLADLGLELVTLSRDIAANGMTAVKYPPGFGPADVLPKLAERGIVVAAGLHKDMATKYFRVGHMGVTVVDKSRGDLETVMKNVKEVLAEGGWTGKA